MKLNNALFTFIIKLGVCGLFWDSAQAADMSIKQNKAEFYNQKRRLEIIGRQSQMDQSMSIFTRRNGDFDPLNVFVGPFTLEPSLTTSFGVSDNIYDTYGIKISDQFYTFSSNLRVRSDLPRHMLEADFHIEDGNFIEQTTENYRDYSTLLGGRVDVTSRLSVPLSAKYSQNHTKRNDPDDVDGVRPTVFDITTFQSGINYIGGLFKVSYNVGMSNFSYQDGINSSSVIINNDDRNRIEWSHALTLSAYEIGKLSPFVYFDYRKVSYDAAQDDFNINRDSSGWGTGLGVRLNLTPATIATLKYGNMTRNFDDPSLSKVDETFYGADISWEPSSLMGINFSAQRFIDETSLVNTSASVNTSMGMKLTYELAPNIYLYPELGYLVRDYQSSDNREIKRLNAGLKTTYKMNRNVWATVSYENYVQDEERIGQTPTTAETNKMMLSLKLQL